MLWRVYFPLLGGTDMNVCMVVANDTWKLLCSSCFVVACFLLRDHNILPQQELHSLQVCTRAHVGNLSGGDFCRWGV